MHSLQEAVMPCAVLTKKSSANHIYMGVKQVDCPLGAFSGSRFIQRLSGI